MKKGGSKKAKEGKVLSEKYLPVTGETQILDLDLEEKPEKPKKKKSSGEKKTVSDKPQKAERKEKKERSESVREEVKVSGEKKKAKKEREYQRIEHKSKIQVSDETMELLNLDDEMLEKHTQKGKKRPESKNRREPAVSSQTKRREKPQKQRKEKAGALDYIVGLTGAAVILVACITLGMLSQKRTVQAQMDEVAQIGMQLENIGIVGESTLLAVSDGQFGENQAAELAQKESEDSEFAEYEEKELKTEVNVGLKLSSVEKDLKIKFTNKKTGKLIPHTKFEVSIKGPDKTYNKTDDDQDGIIYLTGITPGSYTVTITAPAELEGGSLEGISEKVTVKDKIEYKKIDVTDEVKTESEVNASKEDTAVHNTPTESLPTDTVEWVESTKTPLDGSTGSGAEYVEVNKSDIPDPFLSASADVRSEFVRLAGVMPLAERTAETQTEVQIEVQAEVQTKVQTETGQKASNQPAARTEVSPATEAPQTENTGTEAPPDTEPSTTTEPEAPSEPSEPSQPSEPEPSEPEPSQPSEPEKPKLNSISLNPSSLSLKTGETGTLSISYDPSDAEHGMISWSTSDGNVAGISDGTVTAKSAGTATITVSVDGKTATCSVNVASSEVKVTGLSINGAEKVNAGSTVSWSVSIAPDGATNKSVSWSSDNSGIASVDGNGTVKGVSKGETTIRVSAQDGSGVSASKKIVVEDPDAADISLSVGNFEITAGEKRSWKEIPGISYSGPVSGGAIESSSNTKVATVSDGKIHAKRAGTSDVKIRIWGPRGQDKSKTVTVTVVPAGVDTVTVSPASVTMKVGEEVQLTGKVGTTGYTGVIWESRDESIIYVDGHGNGKIKALKPGKTQVWAHSSEQMDRYAVCEVTVVGDQDLTQPLKDKNGNQLYYKDANGAYQAATIGDYSKYDKFYLKKENTGNYKYTGWQTLDGKTYYFDKNGVKVTGDQTIKGVKYSFGSDGALVNNSSVLGIDVSKHNGNIDWNAVKASGVNYAIIRCGYRGSATGVLVEDPKFKANIQGAINAGLKVGVYFFTQAVNEVEAVEEASMTVSLIKNYKISYPVFLDVESANGRGDAIDTATRTKVINAYCQTIRNSGYTAGIYANKTWLTGKMNLGALSGYKIWYAQYAAAPTYSGHMDIWQYSCKGSIPGIKGDVDLNISYMG